MNIKRIFDYLLHPRIASYDTKLRKSYGHLGENSNIYSPYIISHPQSIYVGDNTTILDNAEIRVYPERTGYNNKIEIGNHCYAREYLTIIGGGDVKIGDGCLFARNVSIASSNHGMNPESEIYYMDQPLILGNVEIGEGCWLGENVLVLPGKKIGKKCIIGAGAVVSHDIPDYSLAVGNPARVVKKYDFVEHQWKSV